jgi:predicted negative regulator of RcsB-dependent stress response
MTKQELKAPDKIWVTSKRVFDWFSNRWLEGVIALVAIFVLSLGLSIYWGLQNQNEAKAQYHYAKAKALFEQKSVGGPQETKKAADELQQELSILDQEFGSTKTNRLADLMRAHMALDSGKAEDALKFVSQYSGSLPSASRDLGIYPSAVMHEQLGKLEQASKDFAAVAKMEGSAFRELAYLGHGRVLRSLKKESEALKVYNEFLEKFPNSFEAGRVRGVIAQLQSQSPAK